MPFIHKYIEVIFSTSIDTEINNYVITRLIEMIECRLRNPLHQQKRPPHICEQRTPYMRYGIAPHNPFHGHKRQCQYSIHSLGCGPSIYDTTTIAKTTISEGNILHGERSSWINNTLVFCSCPSVRAAAIIHSMS